MSKKDPYRAVSWLNRAALVLVFVGAIVAANGLFIGLENPNRWGFWYSGMALVVTGLMQLLAAQMLFYRIWAREITKIKPSTAP